MHTTETLERACADAWPPLVTDKLGDWQLRAADGFTGRANSALAVGSPGMPVPAALHRVREFAHSHGIEPRVHAVHGSEVDSELRRANWHPDTGHSPGALVSVQLGPLAANPSSDAVLLSRPTPGWWKLVTGASVPTETQRHVLGGGDTGRDVAYCAALSGADTVGAARGVVVDDLLYLSGLAVRPQYRRRGLAGTMMDRLGTWAGSLGATRCVLQVATHNTGALALYARRGFTESHRYRYWVPASTCEDHTL